MAITLNGTTGITTPDNITHEGDTNTAIRFPAADTVTVETSGSERLRIDASGNVGIGASLPGATGISPFLAIGANNAGVGSASANNIVVVTNNAERMRIDSAGRVTMPYQPAFDVGYSPAGYSTLGNVVFNTVFVNVGGHYSTSNGRFTAPVAGSYFFYTSQIKNNDSAVARRRFDKNGAPATGGGTSRHLRLDAGQSFGDSGALVSIIYLNAGDYVTVDQFAGSSYGTLEYDYFGGYLIG